MHELQPKTGDASAPPATELCDDNDDRKPTSYILRIDELIADISARMVKASGETLDKEISEALQAILVLFRADRCGLMEVKENSSALILAHAYQDPEVPNFTPGIEMAALYPWSFHKLITSREPLVIEKMDDLPPEASIDRQSHLERKTKSSLVIPLLIGQKVHHLIGVGSVKKQRTWDTELIKRVRVLGEILVSALHRRESERLLNQQFEEIERLRRQLELENIYLRNEAEIRAEHRKLSGTGKMQEIMAKVEQVAGTNSTVLIQGETGTGKEVLAELIHERSDRAKRLMVKVNCAALPSALVESELFGREKGAFTGAISKQIGRFEVANGATLFLDEIAELPLETQAKLLRVLQQGEFERLGSPQTIKVNVRVIAATNHDLAADVEQGRFRRDLYYRLNVFPILLPPLRERKEEIPSLVWKFVSEFGEQMGKRIRQINSKDMQALVTYGWPGNIRELRNVIEHAMIISSGETLQLQKLVSSVLQKETPIALEDVERQHIQKVLEATRGKIKGAGGAAELLRLNPATLYSRMHKLGIPLTRS